MININDILRIWLTDTAIWLQLKDKRQAVSCLPTIRVWRGLLRFNEKNTQYPILDYTGPN